MEIAKQLKSCIQVQQNEQQQVTVRLLQVRLDVTLFSLTINTASDYLY
jgi:hypothetical protein